MTPVTTLPPAAVRYLEELELALKQLPGVAPEEALSDAREFLLEDASALARSGQPLGDEQLYQHKDLDSANLTEALGTSRTTDELRSTMHRPLMTIALILGGVALILAIVWLIVWAGVLGGGRVLPKRTVQRELTPTRCANGVNSSLALRVGVPLNRATNDRRSRCRMTT